MNFPALRLPCWPVIRLNLDSMSLWPNGLQAIILAARISIHTIASSLCQGNVVGWQRHQV
jgi:hypothetical protein